MRHRLRLRRLLQSTEIGLCGADLARKTELLQRIAASRRSRNPFQPDHAHHLAASVASLNIVAPRERYDRVAAHFGIEPRDPYLDRDLVACCLAMPQDIFQRDGWPKWIQRRAMQGHLPDAVIWRRGKDHLGWRFSEALASARLTEIRADAATMLSQADWTDAKALVRAGLGTESGLNFDASVELCGLQSWIHAN